MSKNAWVSSIVIIASLYTIGVLALVVIKHLSVPTDRTWVTQVGN
jgi:hypothetical protein